VIILDTDVVSGMMRRRPDRKLLDWFDRHDQEELAVTAMTIYELEIGIAQLDEGRRKQELGERLETMWSSHALRDPPLPFTDLAARRAAMLTASLARSGTPVGFFDVAIAAIALEHGGKLATRNTRHFSRIAGLLPVSPWDD